MESEDYFGEDFAEVYSFEIIKPKKQVEKKSTKEQNTQKGQQRPRKSKTKEVSDLMISSLPKGQTTTKSNE